MRRAAGQRDGVDRLDDVVRRQQRFLAGAGTAAADIDRGDRRPLEQDGGDTGGDRWIVGMADGNAGNIGEKVFSRWVHPPAVRSIRYSSRDGCINRRARADGDVR
ncbi:hypothetical protein ABIF23_003293 [Bradyrhizobium elkanii]